MIKKIKKKKIKINFQFLNAVFCLFVFFLNMQCKNNIEFNQSSSIMITKDSIVFNVCSKHCMKNVELEQFIIIDTAITSILCKKK